MLFTALNNPDQASIQIIAYRIHGVLKRVVMQPRIGAGPAEVNTRDQQYSSNAASRDGSVSIDFDTIAPASCFDDPRHCRRI